jgi:hypothetical protein
VFRDPLLRRAALVVEGDDAFGWTRQVGDDEADTRIKLRSASAERRFSIFSAASTAVRTSSARPFCF